MIKMNAKTKREMKLKALMLELLLIDTQIRDKLEEFKNFHNQVETIKPYYVV